MPLTPFIGLVFLTHLYGDAITEDEARNLMSPFGAISKTWVPSNTELVMNGLPAGVFLEFVMFDNSKDAVQVSSFNKPLSVSADSISGVPRRSACSG